MDELLLHPRTRAELTALLHDAPHALLLVAPTGTGKFTVATRWAKQLAPVTGISVIEPDEKGTISIDATRALYRGTRGKQSGWQVVIINHAEAMSGEAQNAFLKLLEEPRARLTFILTAPASDVLLPTILSRVQSVLLQPVSPTELQKYAISVKPGITAQELTQLLFVASGRPAILAEMLADGAVFDRHKQLMQRAKTLVGAGPYERLAMVQELTKDKHQLVATLEATAHMVGLQLRRDPKPGLIAFADALQECLHRLQQNGNPRAQLTHLFMQR